MEARTLAHGLSAALRLEELLRSLEGSGPPFSCASSSTGFSQSSHLHDLSGLTCIPRHLCGNGGCSHHI